MYQIEYQCGYEIQVAGDLCRVSDQENRIVYEGTYEACDKWLRDRAVRPISDSV